MSAPRNEPRSSDTVQVSPDTIKVPHYRGYRRDEESNAIAKMM
jgi:hypothetical protein